MSETLIYILIFAAIMFFMHRGQGHGMGGCGGHSHGSHNSHNHGNEEPSGNVNKENERQHHY